MGAEKNLNLGDNNKHQMEKSSETLLPLLAEWLRLSSVRRFE